MFDRYTDPRRRGGRESLYFVYVPRLERLIEHQAPFGFDYDARGLRFSEFNRPVRSNGQQFADFYDEDNGQHESGWYEGTKPNDGPFKKFAGKNFYYVYFVFFLYNPFLRNV